MLVKLYISSSAILKSWLIHAFTTVGVLCAFYSVVAAIDGNPESSLLWLVLAQIIDGIDGPLARKFMVKKYVPVLDGNVLDLVIDYVTCVFVPVIFMLRFELVPPGLNMVVCSLILASSAIWFARKDIETKDMWFRGFPAGWNLVVTVMWLFGLSPAINTLISVVLVVVTITPQIKFFHILGSPQNRKMTILLSGMMILSIGTMMIYPTQRHNIIAKATIIVWVIYAAVMSVWRTLQPDEII